MEGGPPRFRQGFTCPVLLRIPVGSERFRIRGFHPLWRAFPDTSPIILAFIQVLQPQSARTLVWARLRSLAATSSISIDFSSGGYLDVSVPHVCSTCASFSRRSHLTFVKRSCLIRKSPDKCLITGYPKLIAGYLRPSSPLTAKVSTVCP